MLARSGNSGNDRSADPHSFQSRFGVLVRRYREKAGLTQMDVARLVFRDETKTTRVSDVERGRYDPRPQTVADYRAALRIPEAEIDDLRRPLTLEHDLVAEVNAAFGLTTEGLIEGLAFRFLVEHPDAARAELANFLSEKAKDWQKLEQRIAVIEELDKNLEAQTNAARAALSRGDFQLARQILTTAEDLQRQDQALLAGVLNVSEIRAAQADVALLEGDVEQAYEDFKVAVGYLAPFAPYKSASNRTLYAAVLVEHYIKYGGTSLDFAFKLFEANLVDFTESTYPLERAKTFGNIAVCHDLMSERSGDSKSALKGSESYEEAIRLFEIADDHYELAICRMNFSAVLRIMGEQNIDGSRPKFFLRSLNQAERALAYFRSRDDASNVAKAANNLSATLRTIGVLAPGDHGVKYLEGAEELLNEVLKIHTISEFPIPWAMAKGNLGRVFEAKASRLPEENRNALIKRAILAYDEALCVYKELGYEKYFDQLLAVRTRALDTLS